MKVIRWWGLLVFLIIVTLMVLTWYLLAPKIIADSIEGLGSEALGAKVEVGSVELELFPVAVTLNQLAATDPKQPLRNLFESTQIKFAVDSESLMWKKIIVDEMVIDGLRLDTVRETSGALEGGRKTTKAISDAIDFDMPEMKDVDVKQMVEQADLITLKRVDLLKQSQERIRQEWQKDLDKKAFDNRIETIKTEYDRLSKRLKKNKLNLIKDRKDWKKLKQSIDAERKKIASLSKKIKQDKNTVSSQLSAVKDGPKDDFQAILKNYGLDSGLESMVDKYLGPQFTPWVMQALDMIKDMEASGGEGTNEEVANIHLGKRVLFIDEQRFPDILIKRVKLNGGETDWQLDGNGFDLGYFPWLTGKPAKVKVAISGNRQANLDLSSQWPNAQEMLTQINSQVTSWPVQQFILAEAQEGNWAIDSGLLTANIVGELTLEKIDFIAEFSIESPKMSTPDSLKGWQKSVAKSINQQAKLNFKLTASGSIAQPKLRLSSNLEKILQSALGEEAKNQLNELSGPVKEAIAAKVGDVSALDNFDGNFEQWQSQLTDLDKVLAGILDKIKI